MQNRAAITHGSHEVRLEDRPVPEPGPKEVLVEVKAVGVCGSDVHYHEHGRIGSFAAEEPLVLGRESSGVVAQVESEVARHRVGGRVALEPGVFCGRCRECRHNLCPDVRFFAPPPINGAFANHVTVHEDFAFKLPDNVSNSAGALMEPLSAGDRVLVTGRTDRPSGDAGRVRGHAFAGGLRLRAVEKMMTDIEAMLTIEPEPRPSIALPASRQHQNPPSGLMESVLRHCLSLISAGTTAAPAARRARQISRPSPHRHP